MYNRMTCSLNKRRLKGTFWSINLTIGASITVGLKRPPKDVPRKWCGLHTHSPTRRWFLDTGVCGSVNVTGGPPATMPLWPLKRDLARQRSTYAGGNIAPSVQRSLRFDRRKSKRHQQVIQRSSGIQHVTLCTYFVWRVTGTSLSIEDDVVESQAWQWKYKIKRREARRW